MSGLNRNSLRWQLTAVTLGCLLLPALVVAWLGYGEALEAIKNEKVRSVGRVADIRKAELTSVLRGAKQRSTDFLAVAGARCFGWPDRVIVEACFTEALSDFAKNEGALRAVIFLPEFGQIAYSDSFAVGNDEWPSLKPGQLAHFSKRSASLERHYEILAEDSRRNLKLKIAFSASLINAIFTNDPELGQSGETFLSDENGFFITPARYEATQGHSHPISARPMQTCLSKVSSQTLDLDYRHVPIIHGFRHVPEIGGGCIMAHVDQAEAFAPLRTLKLQIAAMLMLFVIAATALSIAVGKRIAGPVAELALATRELMNGNYQARVKVIGKNEISELMIFFNRMAERMEMTLGELREQKEQLEHRVRQRTVELEAANQKLSTLSQKDGLTGLANRRHLDETLATEWRRAARQGEAISVVMLDVDHFKKFNDHYGHQQGDHCLREVACILAGRTSRAGELVGRYGGEEFLAVLPGFSAEQAEAWAKEVKNEVSVLAIEHSMSPLGIVTVSLGAASVFPVGSDDPSSLIAEADKALYMAKNSGRNQVCVAPPNTDKNTPLI